MNENIKSNRILLNLQMIADDLEEMQLEFKIIATDKTPVFEGFSLYFGQTDLDSSNIYLLAKGKGNDFPSDKYSYITPDDIKGDAPHISCLKQDDVFIINTISLIFERYRRFESKLNNIIINGGTLTDLCREGSIFFKNPMYIHDKYFTVLALPSHPKGMLDFERSKENGSLHIPLWLINEFKFDEAYKNTLVQKNASIWGIDQYPNTMRSLYVNLYDGFYYFGRLLVNELESAIKPGQFQLAEMLAEYAKTIIARERYFKNRQYRDYEDTIRTIIRGGQVESQDIRDFLEIQGWNKDDTYICIKLQSQNPDILIKSDEALRSKLPSVFSESFDFFHEQKLCLIINASKSNISFTDSTIKTALAELVRESLMYCAISNPVTGIFNINKAFPQTDFTLSYIKENNSQWLMSFNECSISYMINEVLKKTNSETFVTPELKILKDIDLNKGTDYYKTLRVFLKNERNISKASEELIIHRTTLLYRLEKINELTHLDLNKEKVRLYIQLSYIMLDNEF